VYRKREGPDPHRELSEAVIRPGTTCANPGWRSRKVLWRHSRKLLFRLAIWV